MADAGWIIERFDGDTDGEWRPVGDETWPDGTAARSWVAAWRALYPGAYRVRQLDADAAGAP